MISKKLIYNNSLLNIFLSTSFEHRISLVVERRAVMIINHQQPASAGNYVVFSCLRLSNIEY